MRRTQPYAALVLLLLVAALFAPASWDHLRAAYVLYHFSRPEVRNLPVESEFVSIPAEKGEITGKVYRRPGSASDPAIVLVPGVHHEGIRDPRLALLAESLAAAGVVVLTPQIEDLVAYRITPEAARQIGEIAEWFSRQRGRRVGVVGISFSGGLALIAASQPRYASHIGFVAAVGAHHEMERVIRFMLTGEATGPGGERFQLTPNQYAAVIMLHNLAAQFFPAEDVPTVRNALGLLVREEHTAAKALAQQLSPEGRRKLMDILEGRHEEIKREMLASLEANREAMSSISPAGKLQRLRAPVLLLHGAGDTVIPPTETLWLAHSIPEELMKTALISPAIFHAEVEEPPSMADYLALINWLAQLLQIAARRA